MRNNAGVVELTLSGQRHAELAALLNDDQRLQAEYPKVAEYLDVALRLPGTGDARGDRAFDLRLVHFMTGGSDVSADPYWEIVGPCVSEHEGRRVVNGGNAAGSPKLAFAQIILQAAYAYAIPSPETVGWISAFCEGRSVVELGAGRGYWARQMERAGLSVEAFDIEPPDAAVNPSFPGCAGQVDVWHPVRSLDGFEAEMHKRAAETVLFLCWPPGWGSSMASTALALYEAAGGERLVFIGQGKGGQTGDDAFFDRLSTGWALTSEDRNHVSWWNSLDVAQAWVRA